MSARDRWILAGRSTGRKNRTERRLGFERLEVRRVLAGDVLHNTDEPADVDDDGRVTLLDMFIMIDELRAQFTGAVSSGEDNRVLYLDVDNNERVNIRDGFLILDVLRSEGEGDPTAVISVLPLGDDVINDFLDIQLNTQTTTIFANGNGNTITQEDDTGNPVTFNNLFPGNDIIVANTDSNDGRFTITAVNNNVLTIDPTTPLTNETGSATIFRVIDTIGPNREFRLGVFGEDRRENALGLFSVYTDVTFDSGLVNATQLDTQSAQQGGPTTNFFYGDYTNGKKGNIATPGLIDEAGALAGLSPTGPGNQLIFTVDMRSRPNVGGIVDFIPDAAEISPGNDILSYGAEQGETIPNCNANTSGNCFGMVQYAGATLTIATTITAQPDTAQVDENAGPTFIDVLANDSITAGFGPQIAAFQTPSVFGGFVAQQGNGLTYEPPVGFTGTDFFFYDIRNGIDTAFAQVTVTVGEDPAPMISGPTSFNTDEDTPFDLSGFTITDPDSNNITVTLNANGQLSQTTFSGTPAQVTNTLNGVTYTPLNNSTANDTIDITASDGDLTDDHTVNITINPINDPPVNTVPGGQSLFNTETLSFTNNEFQVSDVDASTLEVTLDVSQGSLSIDDSGLQVQGNSSGSLTATGSIANLNTALNTLLYDPDNTFAGTDTLTMTTSDLGATGAGGVQTDSDTVDIEVTPPQIPFAASDFFEADEGTAAFILNPNPLNNDFRDDGATLDVTDIVGNAGNSGGSLAFANGNFTYTPPTDVNFFGTETFTYTIEQDPSPSSTGDSTDTGTIQIDIMPINDGPINSLGGTPITTSPTIGGVEDTTLQFSGPNALSISDIDADEGSLTVTLTVGNGQLNVTDTSGVTGNNSSQLTIDGTVSQINGRLGGLSYMPDLNFFGDDSLSVNTNDNGNTGDSALSDNDTVNITIAPVNDPPTLVVPGMQSFFTDFDNRFSSDPAPFSVMDDAGVLGDDIQVDLTIGDGTLTINSTSGLTVTQNPGNVNGIRITGSVNNINNAFASGVDYRTSQPGDKTLNVVVNDLGNTGEGDPFEDSAQVEVEVLDFVPIDIIGQIFVDHDGNCEKNTNDPAIEGVDVVLSGVDFQGNQVSVTDTTNSRGEYLFENLRPNQPGSPYTITQVQPAFIQDQQGQKNSAMLDLDVDGTFNVTDGSLDFCDGGFEPKFADVWRLFALSEEAPNNSAVLFGFEGGSQDWSMFVGPGWSMNRYKNARFSPSSDGNSGVLTVFDNVAGADRTANVSTQAGTLTYRGTGNDRVYRVIGGSSLLELLGEKEGEGESDDDLAAIDEAIETMYA